MSPVAQSVELRPAKSWRAMGRVGLAMLLHDRLKLVGTLVGVIFAVVLSNQQGAILMGLLGKNLLMVNHAGADVWIGPPSAQQVIGGETMSDSTVFEARAAPGVAWAAPILFGGGTLKLPRGGSEQVQIVGVELPEAHGGPFNIVAGRPEDLLQPDAMFFEDSDREKFGGINLGSVREVSGHRTQAVGFTWGMLPFGPSYAFTSFDTARELLKVDNHLTNWVLIGVQPGVSPDAVARYLQERLPDQRVMTSPELRRRTVRYVLLRTAIGTTFGTSALFGLLVGFVIVALTMFSSVVDHLREFGTLKAIGATNKDLAKLLAVQALTVAIAGSMIGEALVCLMIKGIRSPSLALSLPPWMLVGTFVLMVFICIAASTLALLRLRKLEPAMVFRG